MSKNEVKKRIYLVNGRLIRAATNMEAVCYAAREQYKAVIPTQDLLLELVGKGTVIENAKPEQLEI